MKTLFVRYPGSAIGHRFHMEDDGLRVAHTETREDRSILEDDKYVFGVDGVYAASTGKREAPCDNFFTWLYALGHGINKEVTESEVWSAYMDWLSDNRPELKYAMQKIRKNWIKSGLAMQYTVIMLYYSHIKETESLLSCSYNNDVFGMLYSYETAAEYWNTATWDELTNAQRRQAVRNWLENDVSQCGPDYLPPLHTWHESRWDFFFRNPHRTKQSYHVLYQLTENMLINGLDFTDKDVKYIWKQVRRNLQGDELPEQELVQMWYQSLGVWVDNMQVLYNLWLEGDFNGTGRDISTIWHEDYWRYPRDIVIAHDTNDNRLQEILYGSPEVNNQAFEEYRPKYEGYKIDITIDGYRFYTSGDAQQWQRHARTLHQCVFNAGYYKYKGIIVFVEKDDTPYGTIHCEKGEILQARVDQANYSKSEMPKEIQDMFLTHVVPQYKVLQG